MAKKKRKVVTGDGNAEPEAAAEHEATEQRPKKKKLKAEKAKGAETVSTAAAATTKESSPPTDETLTVFVGGIARTSVENDLRAHFQQCGEITECSMPCNARNVPMGIAFITFKSAKAVKRALAITGSTFNGKDISVKMRKNKEKSAKALRKEAAELARSKGKHKSQDGNGEVAGEEKPAGKRRKKKNKREKNKSKGKGKGKGKDSGTSVSKKDKGKGKGKGEGNQGEDTKRAVKGSGSKKFKNKLRKAGVEEGAAITE